MRNAIIAGLLTGIAFGLAHLGIISSLVETIIYAVAIILGGYYWSRQGIEEFVKEKKIDIEILMLAATIGSIILGMWDEAAFLVFLYGTAEGLEEYTYAKTRASIRKLLDLAPKKARVIRNGKEMIIPAEQIAVGDVFLIKPGESIATDGIILEGRSSINEAPITGESIPVEKKEQMKVFAATLNQEGALKIRATATYKDNTIAKIVHMVEEAQEQKSNTQLFIEKFGQRYSPLVLLGSFLLLVIPPLFGESIATWATKAVVLLVAAAPCALVMSTPVAIAAGIGRAGRSGVLIKGGVHLENLGEINVVCFDKTGTLTIGKPQVTDVVAVNSDNRELLALASSVERFSEHPLAQAIVKKAASLDIDLMEATEFSALIGSGAKAKISNKTIFIGKPELFEELGKNTALISDIDRLKNQGKTVILVGSEEYIIGIIALRDEPKAEAQKVINQLHGMGIKIIMLTGDNELTAKAIGKELGIDEVKANLTPQEKIKVIDELTKKYGAVAMVGDGINDAPALAKATVGISMGAIGTDAAIEAADTVLMADDLNKVVYAINLGKRAKQISSQNIIFSILILTILIPSALVGAMTVAIAVLFHEVSELLAVANGLRMAKEKL
jgi:Cd2+/Zn2+-exporting ATPase